jgi:hypothetical protein
VALLEHIEVECLTDESGTAYAASFYVGRNKVYSKWTRLSSAEKLARTLRNAFGESPSMDPEAARTAGVLASGDGWVEAGLVCQACAGDAPRGKCLNPRCVGGPIVRELVPGNAGVAGAEQPRKGEPQP